MSRIRSKPGNDRGGSSGMTMGLIALAAVALAIGLGYFLGKSLMVGGGKEPVAGVASTTVPSGAQGAVDVPPAVAPQVNPNATAAPIGKGAPPVSKEEQPIGANEPRLWVPEAAEQNWTYSLGDIPSDSKTEKEFTVQNIGNSTLVIEDVSASCGCTTSTIGSKELAPGATTTLRVSYDPRVNGETGRFVQKQVRIKSNDPLVPLAEFTITADVAAQ